MEFTEVSVSASVAACGWFLVLTELSTMSRHVTARLVSAPSVLMRR